MRRALTAVVTAGALCCAGCLIGRSGVQPPDDDLHFPTAAALSPDGGHLVVANSNFDLAYRNGTIVLVDLDAVASHVDACPVDGCEPVDASEFILEEDTVEIGSFASLMTASPEGPRMYVTVRGDTSLTWFEVDDSAAPGRRLTCFDPDSPPKNRKCDSDHRVSSGLPPDPHDVTVVRRRHPTEGGGDVVADWLFVTHLTSGKISVLRHEVEEGLDRDLPPSLVLVSESFADGVSAVVEHPLYEDLFYVPTRHASFIYTFRFTSDVDNHEQTTRLVLGPTISLDVLADGHDNRDLAFSADGDAAFATNRSPNSLVVVDTSLDDWGWPRNRVVGLVELDSGPSMVTTWQPEGRDDQWVYATSYNGARLHVIDPFLRRPVDVIHTGNGPHVFVTDPGRLLGYLVNFVESTISVVDLDPDSETFNEIRATIGEAEQVRGNQ